MVSRVTIPQEFTSNCVTPPLLTVETREKVMKKKQITQADIQAALEKFKRAGRLIRRLPAQVAPARTIASGKGIHGNVEEFLAKVEGVY